MFLRYLFFLLFWTRVVSVVSRFQQNAKSSGICRKKNTEIRDLSEISMGGGGGGRWVETEGGSQLFETAEKGGVMKNGPLKGGGSCKYKPMIV